MPVCGVEGCGGAHYGRGYCRPHYRWFVEQGHTELPKLECEICGTKLNTRFRDTRFCSLACRTRWYRREGCYTRESILANRGACSIAGCGEPVHAKKLCRAHAMRLWRHGDALAPIRRVSGLCGEPGCEKPAALKQLCQRHYFRRYLDEHRPELYANANARRTRVQQATPRWADMKAIRKVYRLCAKVAAETGVEHHVDHIVPIKGRGVCGLHVQWNLQVLPGADNRKKSNKT